MKTLLLFALLCGAAITAFVLFCPKPVDKPVAEKRNKTVEEYAANLRKDNDSMRIYELNGHYEVWHKSYGKWREAATVEAARKLLDDYYIEWAKNCMGDQRPAPPANRIE